MDPVSPVILETERLYAREFVREDADDVFEYAGNVESSGSDEEHVVCLYRAVFGVDHASLDYRQDVSLYALPGYVSA